jgi:CHAT domain-containing protein
MNFIKIYVLILISLSLNVGAQTQSQEDKIYAVLDTYVANPKPENLINLDKVEVDFYKNKSKKTKDELLAIVILNCNKAFYENQFGLTQKAISSYEKSWQIFQKNKLNNYDIVEFCLKPLGNLYTIIGDYDNAENIIKQYYFLADANKNQEIKIAAILNLSNVYQNSGKIQVAIDLLKNTIKTEKLSNSQKGNLLNNLGSNYLLFNDDLNAKKAFESSINLLKSDKNQAENLSNVYSNLSNIYANVNNFEIANSYSDKAIDLLYESRNNDPRKVAKLSLDYAHILFKEQNYNKSAVIVSKVFSQLIPNYSNKKSILPNKNSLYAENILLDALDLQADIFVKQNLPKKALETYELSFYIEDLFSNLLAYENSKIINQVRVRNQVEKCISIYDFLFKTEHKSSYLETAFILTEKTKSGVLKNYLSKNKLFSNDEKILKTKLQNLNNEIIKEQQKLDLANLNKINELILKQNQTMLLIKSSQKSNSKFDEKAIDLKKLFAKLKNDNASLIEYFYGQNAIYSFALSENKIVLNSIENSEINKNKITKLLDFFSNPDAISNDISGYNSSGNLVYQMLKLSKIYNKNLIIIPDGLINFVPFEALITKISTTTNFAKMNYLMNDFAISYNNSASFYLDSNALNFKNSILGIFPIFEKTDFELSFSKTELQAIKKDFNGQYFENSNATFKNFKSNVNNFSILHLSTHASAGDIDAPATIKFFDQDILYSELYNLKINPDLVVLSACQTGIGKLYRSEGAMSVARGFQFAGAQNLLFSLWKVNDFTTSVFMENFYKNIKNQMSFSEANQKAKLDFLENKTISNTKKSPYYWSAFVYYGTLEKPSNYNYLIWILGGIIFGFLVWFLMIRNIKNKLPTKI